MKKVILKSNKYIKIELVKGKYIILGHNNFKIFETDKSYLALKEFKEATSIIELF